MAQNINELYTQLSKDEKFPFYFKSQPEFEEFLNNEQNADSIIEDLFDVKGATEFVKKKDQTSIPNPEEESFSSPSPLVGQTEPVVAEPEKNINTDFESAGVTQEDLGYSLLPKLGYGKSFESAETDGNPVDPKKVSIFKGSLDSLLERSKATSGGLNLLLEELRKQSYDGEYQSALAQGKLKESFNNINAYVSEIYQKNPKLFSDVKFQESLKKLGIQNPVEKNPSVLQTQQPAYVPFNAAPVKPKNVDQIFEEKQVVPSKDDELESFYANYLATGSEFQPGELQLASSSMKKQTEQNADKILASEAKRALELAGNNIPTNFFDQPAIVDGEINPNRRLSYKNGLYFINDRGNVKINDVALDSAVESILSNPVGGVLSPKLLEVLESRFDLDREKAAEILKPRLLRLVKEQAQENLNTIMVDRELEKIDADAKVKLETATRAMNKIAGEQEKDINLLVAKSRNLVFSESSKIKKELEDFDAAIKANYESDVANRYAMYTGTVQATPGMTKEQNQALYQDFLTSVNEMTTMAEEERLAFTTEKQKELDRYAVSIEAQAKADLAEINKKYANNTEEQKKQAAAVYRDVKEKYKVAFEKVQEEESKNSGALGMGLTDILQSRSAGVTANAITALTAAVGYEDNPFTGLLKYLNVVQSKSSVPIEQFSKVLEEDGVFSEATLKNVVQQIVQQGVNMAPAMAATMLTGNPYIGGAIGWSQDTLDQVGEAYNSVFERTGSIDEAEDAAASSLRSQIVLAPTYALEMMPFAKGFLSKISGGTGLVGFAKKAAVGITIEQVTETLQETRQQYETYLNTTDDAVPKSYFGWTRENGLTTAIDILPATVVLGGISAGVEAYSETILEKTKTRVLKRLEDTGMSQVVMDTLQVIGDKSINIIPEYLFRGGVISKEEFAEMRSVFSEVVKSFPQSKQLLADSDKQKYYVSLQVKKKKLQTLMENTEDVSVKGLIEKQIELVTKETEGLVTGKEVNFSKVTFADGSSVVLADSELISQLGKQNFLNDLASEEITVTSTNSKVNSILETTKAALKKTADERTVLEGPQTIVGVETAATNLGAVVDNAEKLAEVSEKARQAGQQNTDRIVQETTRMQKILDTISPGVKIVLMNTAEYQQAMGSLNGESSSFGNISITDSKDGLGVEIQINLDSAQNNTVGHEVSHVILLKTLGDNPALFNEMMQGIERSVSKALGNSSAERILEFIKGYSTMDQSTEFLVETASLLGQEGKNLDLTVLEKIARVVSDFVAKITGGKIQLYNSIRSKEGFIDYMNALADTLRTGNVSEKLKTNAVQEQTTGQVPVQPEATVGQEVVQGEPQAEPQVAAEKGQELEGDAARQAEIRQEEVSDFVENADETSFGIAVPVDKNENFTKLSSKSQIGLYDEAVLNGESFSNALPQKTLKQVAEEYEGRLFIITSDGTGYGIDSEGNPIFGGFGFLTHPKNQEDGVGFASVDVSTVKSTITRIRKIYGNKKVAVLVMIQPPHTTINNSYGAHYFIRSMKELSQNPQQLLEAKNSFKQWVLGNKEVTRNLKKEDSKAGKRNTLSALFNLIDSIDSNTNVNEFTKEFLKDTTFDSRKIIFQGLIPEKADLRTDKGTPSLKKLFIEKGFNIESFLAEYGDKTFLNDELISNNKGGFVVGGFEIDIKEEDAMLKDIQDLQAKGFEHPLFNGKLPGTNHFALDGPYGVNENFAKFNKPQRIFDFEKIAKLFKKENLIPAEKPKNKSKQEEGRKYASDKRDDLVRENYKKEGDYTEESVQKAKENFSSDKSLNFEKDLLPSLGYTNLKSAKKIEFKNNIAESLGILKDKESDVATDVARGTGFQPTKEGQKSLKTTEFVKIDKVMSKSQAVRSEESSGTTQVATTTGSYVKAANLIKDIKGKVLDYGAGLGLGTDAMSNVLGRDVDSFEPNPERWRGKKEATYTASDQINEKYDAVVSLNVLNVVPKDIRDAIVTDIFDKLNPNGKAIISTRKWSGDVNGAKNAIAGDEDKSLIITRRQNGQDVEVFQKGFDGNELVDYVQDLLGDNANVVKNTTFGANGVIITKSQTADTKTRSKSQVDYTQIKPEYDRVLNSQFGTKVDAYTSLINIGYSPKKIKEALGLFEFDEAALAQAQGQIAIETMDKVKTLFGDRQEEIKTQINNNLGLIENIYEDLIADGFSPLEIFTAARDMDFMTVEEMKDLFGAEYRQTVQNALDRDTEYPSDFLDDLEQDAKNLKVEQKAAEIADALREVGLGLTDSAVTIDMFLEYLKTNGFDQIAIQLVNGVKQFSQDKGILTKTADWAQSVTSGTLGDKLYTPEAINYAMQTASELFSQAGRVLQMARFFNREGSLNVIEKQLSNSGVVLTTKQRETLVALLNDYQAAQDRNKTLLTELEQDWSDKAFDAYFDSEKQIGLATIRVAQFLDARKPGFYNEKITSGGSRGLLGVATTILSFVANVENNLLSTNVFAKSTQKLRDVLGGGIKATTVSTGNWVMARSLSKKRAQFDVKNNRKYGQLNTSQGLNRYYDNLGQVNFFKDPMWVYKFFDVIILKSTGKSMSEMTQEEQVDAFDLTLTKLKDGTIEMRDGKGYTFARSLAWSVGLGPALAVGTKNPSLLLASFGPAATEFTGRVMSYGGDISFGYMAAQRSMIDYFQNIKGTRFQDGVFDSMLKDVNGKLDKEAIRALSTILRADTDLYSRFEQEGLRRTLLGDNLLSGGISAGRGKIQKSVRALYAENRSRIKGEGILAEAKRQFSVRGLGKNALQLTDIALWTLMPFTKVPVNFLGTAIAKTVPHISVAKYLFSEGVYQQRFREFNKKFPIGKKLTSDTARKQYELAKIDLFMAKRQTTYDAAQAVTSFAIYGFAMSAVTAGAILAKEEPEKEKQLKNAQLRGGLYNATLHREYLVAKAKGLFSGAKTPEAFIARRGGFALPGDKILNTNNFGFLGYAMNLYGSVDNTDRKRKANSMTQLLDDDKGIFGLLAQSAISGGIENLPMFQGLARIGELVNNLKDPEEAANAFDNFVSGTLSTSMAVFFPSFFSVMAKGNAETVQSASEIFTEREKSTWTQMWGTTGVRVVQKLNRNISFNENTRNEFYEAAIGPFGEDLSYKVTLADPGTAGAYFQAIFDPFAIRSYDATGRYKEDEKNRYIEAATLNAGLINLGVMYQQMTGRDYVFTVDGKKSGFYQIMSNAMKNQFKWSEDIITGIDGGDINRANFVEYTLPNDLYRKELKERGESMRMSLRSQGADIIDTIIPQIQNYVNSDRTDEARLVIENFFEQYQDAISQAKSDYTSEYKTQRETGYLREMNRRGLISPEMMQKLKRAGVADTQGRIL
jgi:hypothetical protein